MKYLKNRFESRVSTMQKVSRVFDMFLCWICRYIRQSFFAGFQFGKQTADLEIMQFTLDQLQFGSCEGC